MTSTAKQALRVLGALLVTGCGAVETPTEFDEQPIDELSEAIAATSCPVSAAGAVCSGTGSVWSALHRAGRSASSLSEVAQTFVVTETGAPGAVRLKLRRLRDVEGSPVPDLVAALRVVSGGVVPTGPASDFARATLPLDAIGRGLPQEVEFVFASTTPASPVVMAPGTVYALVLSAEAPASGMSFVGIASHRSDTYAGGQAWRRGVQATDAGFVDKAFVPVADGSDLSFSFTVAASCSDGLRNQGETEIDCGGPCSSCDLGVVTLTNPNSVASPAGDQVRLGVGSVVAAQSTFSVVAGGTSLPFCFEQSGGNCTASPVTNTVWVRLAASVPAGGSVSLAFRPQASSAAVGGTSVFDFLDDFDDGNVTGWQRESASLAWATQDGATCLRTVPAASTMYAGNAIWHPVSGIGSEYVVESRLNDVTNATNHYPGGLTILFQDASNWIALEGSSTAWTERGERNGTDTNWINNFTPNIVPSGWQVQRVDVFGASGSRSHRVWIDGVLKATKTVPSTFQTLTPASVGVGKHGDTGTLFIDWIRVRRYTSQEFTAAWN